MQADGTGSRHSEHRSVLLEHTKLTEHSRRLDLVHSARKDDR
jgi:hypothetical protein